MRNLYETVQEATGCYKCIYRFISSFAFGDIVCIELYIPRSERFEGRGEEGGSEGDSGPDSGSKMGHFRPDFGVEIGSAPVSLACDEWFENVVDCGGIVKKRGFGLTLTPSNLDLWGVSNGVPNPPFSILCMGGTSPHASALASAPHEIQGQQHNYQAFRDIFRAGVPRLQPPEARKGNLARKSRSTAQWLEGKSRDRGKRKSKSALRSGEKRGNVDLELDSLRSAEYYSACFARGVSRRHPREAQSRKPRLRGKDLGSGRLQEDGFDARLERHRAGEGYSYGCPVF